MSMNFNIDGQNYDLDKLSDEAKAQIASIQAVDAKLNELKRDSAIVMTARNMYVQALKKSLEQVQPSEPSAAAKSAKKPVKAEK
jgi:sarcosine oxidase gamma subunit